LRITASGSSFPAAENSLSIIHEVGEFRYAPLVCDELKLVAELVRDRQTSNRLRELIRRRGHDDRRHRAPAVPSDRAISDAAACTERAQLDSCSMTRAAMSSAGISPRSIARSFPGRTRADA
jgi:hypothetical protein